MLTLLQCTSDASAPSGWSLYSKCSSCNAHRGVINTHTQRQHATAAAGIMPHLQYGAALLGAELFGQAHVLHCHPQVVAFALTQRDVGLGQNLGGAMQRQQNM